MCQIELVEIAMGADWYLYDRVIAVLKMPEGLQSWEKYKYEIVLDEDRTSMYFPGDMELTSTYDSYRATADAYLARQFKETKLPLNYRIKELLELRKVPLDKLDYVIKRTEGEERH